MKSEEDGMLKAEGTGTADMHESMAEKWLLTQMEKLGSFKLEETTEDGWKIAEKTAEMRKQRLDMQIKNLKGLNMKDICWRDAQSKLGSREKKEAAESGREGKWLKKDEILKKQNTKSWKLEEKTAEVKLDTVGKKRKQKHLQRKFFNDWLHYWFIYYHYATDHHYWWYCTFYTGTLSLCTNQMKMSGGRKSGDVGWIGFECCWSCKKKCGRCWAHEQEKANDTHLIPLMCACDSFIHIFCEQTSQNSHNFLLSVKHETQSFCVVRKQHEK